MPSLQFKGKALVQNHHLAVPFCELEPEKSKGLSKNPSLHDNLIIEGDNLRALKALLPTYHGKVKCIYIDPPYNTGNEGWVYNDKVNSPMIRDWLGKTVDRDDLTRHDKWCCMMLPRLRLLRELLSDDGAIFVSIDDNEVHHLRALMDEVFGVENFVVSIAWHKRVSPANDAKFFSTDHDHIIVYARHIERWSPRRLALSEEQRANYLNPDEDPRGLWNSAAYTCAKSSEERPNLYYAIIQPNTGKEIWPSTSRVWAFEEMTHKRHAAEDKIYWGKDGLSGKPRLKKFLSEAKPVVPRSIWTHEEAGHNQESNLELAEILPHSAFFGPKPTRLIRRILEVGTNSESIILDSFAGSGTTAQAVLTLNKEDGGNRRFILCQMPFETKEQEDKGENIADTITAERVRRVIQGVPGTKDEALRAGLGGSFSYFRLGHELRKQAILDGRDLPNYESLAAYIFFTATGEEFQPDRMRQADWFIGESREYDVFLQYEPEVEKLKNLALGLDEARKLPSISGKKKLVFSPTKYLDQEHLDRYRIVFCQLPFEIYQSAERA